MKTHYKIIILFLFSSSFIFGQEESLFSKSFETNSATTGLITFNNGGGTVEIEESDDGKFHVRHSIEFKNYSDRQKSKIIEEIRNEYEFDAKMEGNHVTTTFKNKSNGRYASRVDSYMNSGHIRIKKNDSLINHKENETFIDEIMETKTPEFAFINLISNTKYLSEGRKRRTVENFGKDAKAKTYHVKVKIKVPRKMDMTINSDYTKIEISGNLKNKFSIRCNGGLLTTEGLENSENVIKIKDGIVIMNTMSGGELTFNSAKSALIGDLRNVKLNSEFSKIEIGQISENTKIEGFNNQLIIHNFDKDFKTLDIESEYSEINMFYPKTDNYILTTFGTNTAHYIDGERKTFKTKEGENSKMFELNNNKNSSNPNKIILNTEQGIIRLGKNEISLKK